MSLHAFKKVVARQYFSRNFFPGKSGSQKNFENEYFLQVWLRKGVGLVLCREKEEERIVTLLFVTTFSSEC